MFSKGGKDYVVMEKFFGPATDANGGSLRDDQEAILWFSLYSRMEYRDHLRVGA
ncbi:hypothetical protein ACFSQ7_27645 [Paenibacillus rhizoplanae]